LVGFVINLSTMVVQWMVVQLRHSLKIVYSRCKK